MATPFIGEIRSFAFGLVPKGWTPCNGQLLTVNQNQALFSVLGTTYGGNGSTNFALPNLQGAVPVSAGQMTDGPAYNLGQAGGSASVPLSLGQIPSHQHNANGSGASVSSSKPGPTVLPGVFGSYSYNDSGASVVNMGESTIGNAGGGQGHENRQPYLALNYCIALQGIFPSRS